MLCIISIEVVDGVVSIRFITPYLTDFSSYIIVRKQARLVIKLRDFCLTIIDVEAYMIAEVTNLIAPCNVKFPSSILHVSHILQRSSCTYDLRNLYTSCQHTCCTTVEPVECCGKTILKGIEIEANIKRSNLLPSEVAAYQARRSDVSGLSFSIQDVSTIAM